MNYLIELVKLFHAQPHLLNALLCALQLKEKKDTYESETKKKKEAFKMGRIVGKVRIFLQKHIL